MWEHPISLEPSWTSPVTEGSGRYLRQTCSVGHQENGKVQGWPVSLSLVHGFQLQVMVLWCTQMDMEGALTRVTFSGVLLPCLPARKDINWWALSFQNVKRKELGVTQSPSARVRAPIIFISDPQGFGAPRWTPRPMGS